MIESPHLGTNVLVRLVYDGNTKTTIEGKLADFYYGDGPIRLENPGGGITIIPAKQIKYVSTLEAR